VTTRICVSLAEETTAAVIDRMVDLSPVADLFEIRGDLLAEVDLLTLLRARTRPLVFTCRPAWAGGRWQGDEDRRRLTLLEAVRRGYDYVDVELESRFLDVAIEKSGSGLIVSHHDFEGTPDGLRELYDAMCDHGADIVKLAVTPRGFADVVRVVALAEEVAAEGGTPLVAIAMGPLGVLTRILGGRWKAPFTYAAAAAGEETAPGQLTAAQLANVYHVRHVQPDTRVYGILGSDVQGSLSPSIHNRAFEAEGLDAVYVPLQSEALQPFLDALPLLRLSGFGVTRPYKHEIVARLGEVEESAALAGSVNTVVREGDTLRGLSTDGDGVLAPLLRHGPLERKSVLVLGAGGAARAAALAQVRAGAFGKVLARKAPQAVAVATDVDCGSGTLATLPQLAWDILINATPVGSGAQAGDTLVPAALHRRGSIVFDMVYDPMETRLLREAQAAGCTVIGGLEMLVSQAYAQFEALTGRKAPQEAMKAAALVAVQRAS
jgi:3-dehydroquinate dehydratase/shikimate dehydrogenase